MDVPRTSTGVIMSGHAHPEILVTTDWVAEHSNDDGVCVVEVNVDTDLYDQGHIAGAVGWSWKTQFFSLLSAATASRMQDIYWISSSSDSASPL